MKKLYENASFLGRRSIEKIIKNKNADKFKYTKIKNLVGLGLVPLIPALRMLGQEY